MAICLLVPMPSLSRLPARSLFPAQSPSGLPIGVFLLPPHRMSDELVKTARADRSSVKPFQFIPIPFRPRIGCRMMCSLAACPLRHVPPSSCLLAAFSSVPLIRLAPRPVVRVVPLSSYPPVHLVSSAHPFRSSASLCLPAPSLVSSGGASSSRSHLVMRFACRPCVLAYRPSFHSLSGCGCGCHRFAHAFRCYRAASAPSRLCGRVLLSACLCYTVCRGDVDHRIRGIRARSHKPPQLTGGGVVLVFQFS